MALIKLAETATFGVFILKFIISVRPESCTNALAALQGSQRTPYSLWLHIILFCPTAKIFDYPPIIFPVPIRKTGDFAVFD